MNDSHFNKQRRSSGSSRNLGSSPLVEATAQKWYVVPSLPPTFILVTSARLALAFWLRFSLLGFCLWSSRFNSGPLLPARVLERSRAGRFVYSAVVLHTGHAEVLRPADYIDVCRKTNYTVLELINNSKLIRTSWKQTAHEKKALFLTLLFHIYRYSRRVGAGREYFKNI